MDQRDRIKKKREAGAIPPNLANYERDAAAFTWAQARAELTGLPGGGLNIAYEAVDRHAKGPLANHVALRWLGKKGERRDITYAQLKGLTARFANVLCELGVQEGERVFCLMGRIPETYIAALGTLKAGAVFCPLFSAFGPEPIHARMEPGGAKVLVTTPLLYKKKIAPLRDRLPELEHVLLVDPRGRPTSIEGTRDLNALMGSTHASFAVTPTSPQAPALLHFTSGTTGKPKGALHVHEAVVVHHSTGRQVLDLREGDVFWCTADPGWVTGTSYGIIAPLTCGATNLIDEAEFDPARWYQILDEERVSVWYTAPTAIRMLMKAGVELAQSRTYPQLRHMVSVGEPLNPEAVVWGMEALGMPFHDTWWQTETGGIMVANYPSMDIKPGSMGKPLPGIEAAIVEVGESGKAARVIDEPGVEGMLALRAGWPSMFREYLHNEARYQLSFADGWYLSGDLAERDADGYFWFVGRADDVIKTAGHLIGPFEVESALMEHPAVAEVGVIGKPDEMAGTIIKAFVSLKDGFTPGDDLMLELKGFARKRLGPAVAPREFEFSPGLPKTRSGKIMRRLLKARELGLPEGDTSTLEGNGQ